MECVKKNNLHNLIKLNAKVFIFVWNSDYQEHLTEYKELERENVRFVVLDEQEVSYRGLTSKLHYAFNYMQSLGIEKYWRLDDDLQDFVEVTEGLSKSRRKIPLEHGLKLLQGLTDGKEYGLVSSEFDVGFIKFWNQKELGRNFATCSCCVLLNVKLLSQYNINYDLYFKEGCEDDDICLQCYANNISTYRVRFMGLKFTISLQATGNTFTTEHDIGKMKLFNKWGNVITTKIKQDKKTGNLIFWHKFNFRDFAKFTERLNSKRIDPIFEVTAKLNIPELYQFIEENNLCKK